MIELKLSKDDENYYKNTDNFDQFYEDDASDAGDADGVGDDDIDMHDDGGAYTERRTESSGFGAMSGASNITYAQVNMPRR